MGLVDVFNPEDRVEVTKSELFGFMYDKAKCNLIVNGIRNGVDRISMLAMLDMLDSEGKVKE